MDFWIGLWTVLLWASAAAFGLVTVYIVVSSLRNLIGKGG